MVWLGCKRYSTEFVKMLPEVGSWLDQDLETMAAFEVIEEIQLEQADRKALAERVQQAVKSGTFSL